MDGAASTNTSTAGIVGAARGQEASTSSAATQSQTTITPVPEPKAEAAPEPLPKSIADFDELIETDVEAFVEAASKVGGLVEQQVGLPLSK